MKSKKGRWGALELLACDGSPWWVEWLPKGLLLIWVTLVGLQCCFVAQGDQSRVEHGTGSIIMSRGGQGKWGRSSRKALKMPGNFL